MREITKGAHDQSRLPRRQRFEDLFERPGFLIVAMAVKADRGFADFLDGVENRVALLIPDRVAQHMAEKPGILAQRSVLVGEPAEFREFRGFRFDCHDNSPRQGVQVSRATPEGPGRSPGISQLALVYAQSKCFAIAQGMLLA
jgi:hypothetical protein